MVCWALSVTAHWCCVCAGYGALPFAGFAGAAGGGVPLCAELLALFRAPEEAAAAERNTGADKDRPEQPGSPEVNNSTGQGWRHTEGLSQSM